MNKQEFLSRLESGLLGLPCEDIEERVSFYAEMIEDSIEEGIPEEEAVCRIGAVDDIISQIISEVPLSSLIKERIKLRKKLKALQIILIVLLSPVWLPLLVSALSVSLSLYVSLWSVILAFWSAFAALSLSALCGIIVGVGFLLGGHGLGGIALEGASLACAGLSIFLFFGCLAATKGTLVLTKKLILWTKGLFIGKERAQ